MEADSPISQRWSLMRERLDERQRRAFAAAEAKVLGRGGVAQVIAATGMARNTVMAGMHELEGSSNEFLSATPLAAAGSTRRGGGGRKAATHKDPSLVPDLLALVDPTSRGDPQSPLRWTCKSLRVLADELKAGGHAISHVVVGRLLKDQGYSLQANAKVIEGNQSPDRNAQFEHINATVSAALAAGQPVISVDTKKKELVGQYKNGGREWHPEGEPEEVQVHDFVDPQLGRANPYGVYDIGADEGWVSVGTDHDTSAFAVQTIRRWWFSMGRPRYPRATELTITADGGGSNGSRVRLWKLELGLLAKETGLRIRVCHFPPGTSKWNKIEHRLFSYIAMNWRGTPLVNLATIVSLIGATRSRSGLRIRSELDRGRYPRGVTVTDAQLATVRLERHRFHGDWNYTIHPTDTPR